MQNRQQEKNINKKLKESIIISELRKNYLIKEINILNQKIINEKSIRDTIQHLFEETQQAKNQETLKKIGKEIGLNLNPSPIYFKLSREIIKDRLDKNSKGAIDQIRKFERDITNLEEDLSNIYICPSCGGAGTIIKVQHHREGRRVTTLKHPKECPLCNGRGQIK